MPEIRTVIKTLKGLFLPRSETRTFPTLVSLHECPGLMHTLHNLQNPFLIHCIPFLIHCIPFLIHCIPNGLTVNSYKKALESVLSLFQNK
jgi:hypothetical protein